MYVYDTCTAKHCDEKKKKNELQPTKTNREQTKVGYFCIPTGGLFATKSVHKKIYTHMHIHLYL